MINRDPDVRLFIRSSADSGLGSLTFHLLVREPVFGPLSKEYGPSSVYLAPGTYLRELKERLADLWKLSKQSQAGAENAQRRLESIGTTLFRQLPGELQERLWSLLGRAETIQILSNELEIPWELMKLQNRKPGSWQSGPFLCEAFAVTRWLHNTVGSLKLPVRDIALVVPRDSQLAESGTERRDVLSLAGPNRKVAEIEPSYPALIEALRSGEHDTWHLCGHGDARYSDPNHMIFILEGEEAFRPDDVNQHGESLSRHQPLIFLNACETGGGGYSLMSLGGWAPNFLEAGAGAFLGTMWPIDDQAARTFANEFYRHFLGGEPIAEALRQARLYVHSLFPGDPSWLAYTAFAHPFASAKDERTAVPSKPPKPWKASAPPDLEIQIRAILENGNTRLEYRLHSPSGALDSYHQEFTGPLIADTPEKFRDHFVGLLRRIEKLNKGFDTDGEILLQDEARRKLEGIGRDLYRQLFPTEMRQAYRIVRERCASLMLVTDDSLIPWELVKPYDDGDPDYIIDDDFLCLRFLFTRWLSSAASPPEKVRVQRFAFLGGGAFPRLGREKEHLADLVGKYSAIEDLSPNEPTLAALESLLDRGGTELFHFGGPVEKWSFQPEDLHGSRRAKIRRDRPFVFFNFDDGRVGWETRWVRDCGCGAFLGPSWNVKDSLAFEFASTLYDALGRGETFGRAIHEARRRLYALAPGVPAWSAYRFYAHVNGRLVFGNPEGS